MNPPLSIRNQRCSTPSCWGKSIIHSRKTGRLRCNICRHTWVVHRNQFRYRLRTALEKIHRALELIQNGLSIHQTAKLLHVSSRSIQRWKQRHDDFIS